VHRRIPLPFNYVSTRGYVSGNLPHSTSDVSVHWVISWHLADQTFCVYTLSIVDLARLYILVHSKNSWLMDWLNCVSAVAVLRARFAVSCTSRRSWRVMSARHRRCHIHLWTPTRRFNSNWNMATVAASQNGRKGETTVVYWLRGLV